MDAAGAFLLKEPPKRRRREIGKVWLHIVNEKKEGLLTKVGKPRINLPFDVSGSTLRLENLLEAIGCHAQGMNNGMKRKSDIGNVLLGAVIVKSSVKTEVRLQDESI